MDPLCECLPKGVKRQHGKHNVKCNVSSCMNCGGVDSDEDVNSLDIILETD
jgi:hypothetical protein